MENILNILGVILGKISALMVLVSTVSASLLSSVVSERVVVFERYPHAVVDNIWIGYKSKIQNDGRVVDRDRNYVSTSEGQSYALLRAVWMDDKEVFDRVLRWTNQNLRKRDGDRLFSWLWGKREDGTWGVIEEEGGENAASDADQDIALALIFAYKRWNEEHYLKEAKRLLEDIWKKEIVIINGNPYITAGNWAVGEEYPTLNPSYFSFAAYPIFAEVDTDRPWLQLKDAAYKVLDEASKLALDKTGSAYLPPDWVSVDRDTEKVLPPKLQNKTTDFSDDAFRVLWRVALDWEWYRDQRAKAYLLKLSFMRDEWEKYKKIVRLYSHDGSRLSEAESPSMYGAMLAYAMVVDRDMASSLIKEKIAEYYNPDNEALNENIGYYSQNWLWFGVAFYAGRLPNLFLAE